MVLKNTTSSRLKNGLARETIILSVHQMGLGPGPPSPSESALNSDGHTSGGSPIPLRYLYEAATSGDICEKSKNPSGPISCPGDGVAWEGTDGGSQRLVPGLGVGVLRSVVIGRAASEVTLRIEVVGTTDNGAAGRPLWLAAGAGVGVGEIGQAELPFRYEKPRTATAVENFEKAAAPGVPRLMTCGQ